MWIPLEPATLHGGVVRVTLPEPPAGARWRVEWRVEWRAVGAAGAAGGADDPDAWHPAASGLDASVHGVTDTGRPGVNTTRPEHRIAWRAVAVDATAAAPAGLPCTICGAVPASPRRYRDPDYGDVALCPTHRGAGLDWT